jgi:hypothetical protein
LLLDIHVVKKTYEGLETQMRLEPLLSFLVDMVVVVGGGRPCHPVGEVPVYVK